MLKTRIYCSGPLFCPEERAGMARIAETLEGAGYNTFLPHRDGLEPFALGAMEQLGTLAGALGPARRLMDRAIFALDLHHVVETCQALVLNLNGRVPDEGGVAEAAVAFAVGRPVVLFKSDARAPFGGYDNSMVLGLGGGGTVGSLDALPEAVAKALVGGPVTKPALGGPLAATVAFGGRVAALLERWPRERRSLEPPEALLSRLREL